MFYHHHETIGHLVVTFRGECSHEKKSHVIRIQKCIRRSSLRSSTRQVQAAAEFTESHKIAIQAGHTKDIVGSLAKLGWIALKRDELASAESQAIENLRRCHLLG